MATQPAQDPQDAPEVARAKRLARLIVADIILYNQDKIAEGIKNDSLFSLLDKDITEGRKYYDRQVDPQVAKANPYFDWALVDQLVKSKGGAIPSKIW
jgi:hypothetical protein